MLKEINPEYSLEGLIEAEAPILWPPDAKSWLIGKDSNPGKDWRQKEKMAAEDEMIRQHHWLSWLNEHESEQTPEIVEDRGAWRAAVHGVTKCQTQLSNCSPTTNMWLSSWLSGKEYTYQCRRHRFDPWVRKIPWRRNGNPPRSSCPGIRMDRGAWQAPVRRAEHNSAHRQIV